MKKLIFIYLLFVSILSYSQTADKPEKIHFLSSGMGFYGGHQSAGFGWNVLSFEEINRSNSWKLKINYLEEIEIFGPLPTEKFYETGFLSGKSYILRPFRFSFHGGLGFTYGVVRGDYAYSDGDGFINIRHYEKENFLIPDIPLEAEITVMTIRNSFEFGFMCYANINWISCMEGGMFKIRIKID